MDELVARITSTVGIDPATATKAVGLILAFLQKEGPADKVAALMAAIPGAQEAIATADAQGGGGFLSNMMGGVMGLGSQLMGMGLGMSEISGVSKQTIAYAREKAGAGPVDAVVDSIPGLSQFV
ncbi:DUF2267 domain-containing protein [Phyllobacterium leguminum]|uniref:DUF2267 domain-containing protein n=1 Tax=Phyllobacterium leguminum TaxID=314237 RepID=A0A318SV73_9HYPH|nr:DUF2267 domain-containing protein [Phyllobacterium leguminum]PYE85315.1 hypothetical protein C7477_13117 [Phyllobacterium leguminum]